MKQLHQSLRTCVGRSVHLLCRHPFLRQKRKPVVDLVLTSVLSPSLVLTLPGLATVHLDTLAGAAMSGRRARSGISIFYPRLHPNCLRPSSSGWLGPTASAVSRGYQSAAGRQPTNPCSPFLNRFLHPLPFPPNLLFSFLPPPALAASGVFMAASSPYARFMCIYISLGTCKQDAVEELATDPPGVIERLRPTLRDLKDLDPAIASLHHRRIQPSRLLSLLDTMRKVRDTGRSGIWRCEMG